MLRIISKPMFTVTNSEIFTLRRLRGRWVTSAALSTDSYIHTEQLSPEEVRQKKEREENDRKAEAVEQLAVGREVIGDDILYRFPNQETAMEAARIINEVKDEVVPEYDEVD